MKLLPLAITLVWSITSASAQDEDWQKEREKLMEESSAIHKESFEVFKDVAELRRQIREKEKQRDKLKAQLPPDHPALREETPKSKPTILPTRDHNSLVPEFGLKDQTRKKMVHLKQDNEPFGTGFLVRHKEGIRIFTTPQDIKKHRKVTARDSTLVEIPITDQISCPVGVSMICLHPTTPNLPCFELATTDELPKVGDKIQVLQLLKDSSYISLRNGTIRGIGPDKFELDVSLDSSLVGSPVVSLPSGKVIGMVAPEIEGTTATWAAGTRHETTRYFALRLDQLSKERKITFERFAKEATYVEDIQQRTHLAWVAHMVMDVRLRREMIGAIHNSPLVEEYPDDESFQKAYEEWRKEQDAEKEILEKLEPIIAAKAQGLASKAQIKRAKSWADDARKGNRHATNDTLWEERASVYRFIHNELNREIPDLSSHLSWYHLELYKAAMQDRATGLSILKGIADRADR